MTIAFRHSARRELEPPGVARYEAIHVKEATFDKIDAIARVWVHSGLPRLVNGHLALDKVEVRYVALMGLRC